MAFDKFILDRTIDELKNIKQFKIDKIYQPDKNTIILGLYGNFTNLALLASISPNNYRIHLTNHSLKNPDIAPNFCMFLRKHILGYKIKDIYVKNKERIVFIELENVENPDKPIYKTLIIELMGKHSNFILIDCNGIIIDSLRHTFIDEKAQRDIYPTSRYILPKPNSINKSYNSSFDELLNMQKSENFAINYKLDDYYFEKESNELFTSYRNNILSLILSVLKKFEKRLSNIDSKLQDCAERDQYKLYGELITANLYRLSSINSDSIILENYYDNNSPIEIPLEKKYSPSYNAKRYFKKYSKLKNALEIVAIQKNETIQDIKYIESIVYEIENCKTIDDLYEVHSEIAENEIFKSKTKQKKSSSKSKKNQKKQMTTDKFANFNPLKFSIDGFIIYVGRNNKENDYLTNKFASKNDIWFHTKDVHGSHVILKTNPNEIIPDNIIYKAAKLAAEHSKAKNSSNVAVDYCFIKFVKKIPGNKPGLVIYKNNKTIFVDF